MKLKIYTDGSYSDSDPGWTYGGMVILSENDKIMFAQRYKTANPEFISGRNVGGELIAAMFGASTAAMALQKLTGATDSQLLEGVIEIYYDYKGVEAFIQGNPKWKANKVSSCIYVKQMSDLHDNFPRVKLVFRKVRAHSGDIYNDMADRIAAGEVPLQCQGKMLQEVEF